MPRKRLAPVPRSAGRTPSFNEAGALCPGKGRSRRRKERRPVPRFNEAGALCPGKGVLFPSALPSDGRASMRPGHCAPEKGFEIGKVVP